MFRVEVIGNLGANAELREYNGSKFVSFRVADTSKHTDPDGVITERTQWFSCSMNGENSSILPYLTKGQKVFIRGRAYLSLYDSKVAHSKICTCDVRVTEVELVGASQQEKDDAASWRQANEYLASLGYDDWNKIPPFNQKQSSKKS